MNQELPQEIRVESNWEQTIKVEKTVSITIKAPIPERASIAQVVNSALNSTEIESCLEDLFKKVSGEELSWRVYRYWNILKNPEASENSVPPSAVRFNGPRSRDFDCMFPLASYDNPFLRIGGHVWWKLNRKRNRITFMHLCCSWSSEDTGKAQILHLEPIKPFGGSS